MKNSSFFVLTVCVYNCGVFAVQPFLRVVSFSASVSVSVSVSVCVCCDSDYHNSCDSYILIFIKAYLILLKIN